MVEHFPKILARQEKAITTTTTITTLGCVTDRASFCPPVSVTADGDEASLTEGAW